MKSKGEALATILKEFKDCCFFLHNTKEFNVVESILKEGFVFESQLSRSTDRVNPKDPVEVTYFLFQRKDYGSFTIVIAIPKFIYEMYSVISNKNDIGLEDVISITDPYLGDNDEMVYTLSPKHVLGYFNIKTSEFFQNKNWDPFFANNKFISTGKSTGKPVKRKLT